MADERGNDPNAENDRRHAGKGGHPHGHRDGPAKGEAAEAVQHRPTEHTADKTTSVTNANPATSSVSAGAPASAGGSRPVSGPAGAIADNAKTNADAAQPVDSPASDEADGE